VLRTSNQSNGDRYQFHFGNRTTFTDEGKSYTLPPPEEQKSLITITMSEIRKGLEEEFEVTTDVDGLNDIFKDAEKNYHSNEKKFLAVKNGIKKFEIYLAPKRFLVWTDNKNFTSFLKRKLDRSISRGRLLHGQLWFKQFEFDTEHIAGTKNCLPDTLTRELALIDKCVPVITLCEYAGMESIKDLISLAMRKMDEAQQDTRRAYELMNQLETAKENSNSVPKYTSALAQGDLQGIFQDTESPVGERKTNFEGSKTTKQDLNLKDMKVEEIPKNTNKQEFIPQDFMQVLHLSSHPDWIDPSFRPKTSLLRNKEKKVVEENIKQLPQEAQDKILTLANQNVFEEAFLKWSKFVTTNDIIKDHLDSEWFISDDGGNHSRAALLQGSPPDIASALFENGLVSVIYPEKDLSELRYMPDIIKSAARSFIRGTGYGEIYIRFYSTIPEWDKEVNIHYPSYHLAWIGVRSENYGKPLINQKREFSSDKALSGLSKRRAKDFCLIKEVISGILENDKKIWLYGANERIIVISNSKKHTSEASKIKLREFISSITDNKIQATEVTHSYLCEFLSHKGNHACEYCLATSPDNGSRASNNWGPEGTLNLMDD